MNVLESWCFVLAYLPGRTERRRCSQRLRNSQWRWVFNPSLLMMWSRNESGVTGCIFHLSVDRTRSSILCIVFASNMYFVSSTWKRTSKHLNYDVWNRTELLFFVLFNVLGGLGEEGRESLRLLRPGRGTWQPLAGSSMASRFENGRWRGICRGS